MCQTSPHHPSTPPPHTWELVKGHPAFGTHRPTVWLGVGLFTVAVVMELEAMPWKGKA